MWCCCPTTTKYSPVWIFCKSPISTNSDFCVLVYSPNSAANWINFNTNIISFCIMAHKNQGIIQGIAKDRNPLSISFQSPLQSSNPFNIQQKLLIEYDMPFQYPTCIILLEVLHYLITSPQINLVINHHCTWNLSSQQKHSARLKLDSPLST